MQLSIDLNMYDRPGGNRNKVPMLWGCRERDWRRLLNVVGSVIVPAQCSLFPPLFISERHICHWLNASASAFVRMLCWLPFSATEQVSMARLFTSHAYHRKTMRYGICDDTPSAPAERPDVMNALCPAFSSRTARCAGLSAVLYWIVVRWGNLVFQAFSFRIMAASCFRCEAILRARPAASAKKNVRCAMKWTATRLICVLN